MTQAYESGFQWPLVPFVRLCPNYISTRPTTIHAQTYAGFIKENIFGFRHLDYKYALAHTHVGKKENITTWQKF